MRFVQFSDCHLGSAGSSSLALPDEKNAILRDDIRDSVKAACRIAKENMAHLVLIPGDVFDFELLKPEITSFLIDLLESLAPTPVFIAPGNHDGLRPGSPYMPASDISWPNNVHIFTTQNFESVAVRELDCTITGVAHVHRGITDRLLSERISRADAPINLLIFHGSREGFRPSDKEYVIPFSDQELANQGFTYAAIGHYHSFSTITNRDGQIIGAYSGCTQGRGLDETGDKIAILGEINSSGSVSLKPIVICRRRIISVDVDVTGAKSDESVLQRVAQRLDKSEAREEDIVCISLIGTLSPLVELSAIDREFSSRYFHVRISRSRLTPDYDIEALLVDSAAAPLRSAFVRKMLERKNSTSDPEELATIDDAIYYGLSALDGRPLEPRDVD